jgi:hypothetical protein
VAIIEGVDTLRPRRIAVVLAMVVVVVATAAVALASFKSRSDSTSRATPSDIAAPSHDIAGTIHLTRDHGPLLLGAPMTLAEAEQQAGSHLPRPNSDLANDSTIRRVFYEKRSHDKRDGYIVAIDYQSGLIVYVHPVSYDGAAFDDPATQYKGMADGLNDALGTSIASLGTVLGRPALFIEPSPPDGVASVDVVLADGFRVQLIAEYASTMTLAALQEAANSIGEP